MLPLARRYDRVVFLSLYNGDLVQPVEAGSMTRDDVMALGARRERVAQEGRDDEEAAAFDPTRLAIRDLRIALATVDGAGDLDVPRFEL
jgi:ornithine cyclodeaminase/alanine dehydrogenase-like protein (mu-crystallin family)